MPFLSLLLAGVALPAGMPLKLAVQPAALLSEGQTVPLAPAQLAAALGRRLAATGIAVGGGPAVLDIAVTDYASGSAIGFAKTAHLVADFTLHLPGQPPRRWQGRCEGTARFGLGSSETRNPVAVDRCLDSLARDLAQQLAGQAEAVLVQ